MGPASAAPAAPAAPAAEPGPIDREQATREQLETGFVPASASEIDPRELARIDWPFTLVNLATTALVLVLPWFFHSTSAIVAFLLFYTVTGLGLTVGYHRLFAHHSYRVPLWLEHLIAICGYLAIQRGPIFWAAMHRLHHKHTDVPGKDPHTPKEGIWHVHFGWTHKRRPDVWDREIYSKLVPDLLDDPLYRFLDEERHDYATYLLLQVLSFGFGGWLGGVLSGGGWLAFDVYNAICFLVWVGMMNRVAVLHAFGLINSVCHLFGARPFATTREDQSTNNLFVALLIFGEGWHNNHHAFPGSARQGLRWWQIDVSWYVISLLRALGLATKVKVAKADLQERKRRKPVAAGPA